MSAVFCGGFEFHGDLHDIGKNMVATMLRGVGFDVVDLGVNPAIEEFVTKVEDKAPDIVDLSALPKIAAVKRNGCEKRIGSRRKTDRPGRL